MTTFTVYSVNPTTGVEVRECAWRESWPERALRKAQTRADVLALSGYRAVVRRGVRGGIVYTSEAI